MHNRNKRFAEHIKGYRPVDYPAFTEWPNPISAGVLIPILPGEDWLIFLTKRPSTLRDHGGEICFPGGKKEPHETVLEAAKREAEEELGIAECTVLGRISSVPLFTSNYRLVPYVAYIDSVPQRINAAEVSQLIPLSFNKLSRLPEIDGIPFHYEGQEYLSPTFDLNDLVKESPGIPIFGGTAIVLYEVLSLLCQAMAIPTPKVIKSQRTWPLIQNALK